MELIWTNFNHRQTLTLQRNWDLTATPIHSPASSRPEPGKGLFETIRVANRLVHRHGVQNLRVLIPEWIGEMVSDGEIIFITG